jgi:hypothetical protein
MRHGTSVELPYSYLVDQLKEGAACRIFLEMLLLRGICIAAAARVYLPVELVPSLHRTLS